MVRMRQMAVKQRGWIDEDEFLEMLSLAQIVPGPNPINMAVLIGLRLRGIAGGIVALLACMLPGFLILLAIAWLLAENPHNRWLHGAVAGCAAAAVGLTVANAYEMSRRFFGRVADLAIIALTFAVVVLWHASIELTLAAFVPLSIALRAALARRASRA